MIIGNYIIKFKSPVQVENAPYLKKIRQAVKEGDRIKALSIYKNATGNSLRKCREFINKFLASENKFKMLL